MLRINNAIELADWEYTITQVRAQGAGGQNVNKVASAVHLRFDIVHSRLADEVKTKLLTCADSRVSKEGVLIIKAQQFRTFEQNKQDALVRLKEFILKGLFRPKKRLPTKPTRAAKQRRLDQKSQRSQLKSTRAKIR